MHNTGSGGIQDIAVFMKKWIPLSNEEPFETREKAQMFIDTYNKDSHLAEKWTETTIVKNGEKFFIYYTL